MFPRPTYHVEPVGWVMLFRWSVTVTLALSVGWARYTPAPDPIPGLTQRRPRLIALLTGSSEVNEPPCHSASKSAPNVPAPCADTCHPAWICSSPVSWSGPPGSVYE